MTPQRVTLGELLGVEGTVLDPDPLRPPETDELLPAAQYVDGYDAGFHDAEHLRTRLLQTTAFGFGVVVGMVLTFVLVYASLATSRPGPNPTAPTPASDVAGFALASTVPATSASGSGQSGAPRTAALPSVMGLDNPVLGAPTARVVSGPATWYDAPSIHDAAAGPPLRKALGADWRGSLVQVCGKSTCVTVILSDWCACGHGRVIDLDGRAFARLAPLSQGIVRVSIELVGAIGEPATATAPPTDVER